MVCGGTACFRCPIEGATLCHGLLTLNPKPLTPCCMRGALRAAAAQCQCQGVFQPEAWGLNARSMLTPGACHVPSKTLATPGKLLL